MHILLQRALLAFPVCVMLCAASTITAQMPGNETLWYAKPAAIWDDALPIGNGRLGAMVFGGANNTANNGDQQSRRVNADIADGSKTRPQDEHLQLNESTIWQGMLRWQPRSEPRAANPQPRGIYPRHASPRRIQTSHFPTRLQRALLLRQLRPYLNRTYPVRRLDRGQFPSRKSSTLQYYPLIEARNLECYVLEKSARTRKCCFAASDYSE